MLPSQSSKFMPTYVSYQHPEMMDIAIAANFTAEPIEDSLRFWAQFLEQNCVFSFAPYNQIFQQLLNTNSKFFVKNKGLNVLLIRLQEWSGEVNRNVDDLINALIEATNHTTRPFLLCFCPATPIAQKDFQAIETSVAAQLANHVGIHVVTSVELNTYYPVRDFYDATGDKLGKIPYTQLFFVALGTRIMRIQHRLQIKPYKVIVLDCDNTLWQGICGEDGALGICISPEYTQLQNFMLNCHQQGMLLCLCSKNNEADVKQVFDCHPDMPLQWQHIVDYRINWQAKSVNIQSLAETLNLGLDSFIFIDDSPMECAEVERHLPQVLSLQLPKNSQDFARFLQHIWAFDSLNITEEDRRRTTFYQANVQRESLRNSTLTLKNFIDELELNVVINFITIEQLPRIAQLTQRTNQFNTTSLRFSEQDLANYLQQYNHYCLTVEVDDRFGHYGLVGVVLYHVDDKKLYVENLLLSCRVLGRMVEHRLLTYLGNIAQQNQLDYVEISYLATARNGLVLDFLRNLVKQNTVEIDDGYLFTFTVLQCIQITEITEITESEKPVTQSKRLTSKTDNQHLVQTNATNFLIKQIATNLATPEQIASAQGNYVQGCSLVNTANTEPATMENLLSTFWQELLQKPVQRDDNFFNIGGDSIKAVQLASRLHDKLAVDLSLSLIFAHPVLKDLASCLESGEVASKSSNIPVRSTELLPCLSFAQQRLLFLNEMGAAEAYNIPIALRLRGTANSGTFNIVAFQQALDTIIQRHEVLRTRFDANGHIETSFSPTLIQQIDLSTLSVAEREINLLHHARADAQRPFNLATDVLLRASVLRLAADEHVLLLNLHHIAGDGWSIRVLAQELKILYKSYLEGKLAILPKLPIQYSDFAAWQRATLQGERLASLLAFWKQQLSGAPELLQLPTDFPRPEIDSYQGGQQFIHIPKTVVDALQSCRQQAGATMYMLLLAAFNVLLYRYTGQDDLLVGSPVASRNRSELEPLIGFFANTLVLRTKINTAESFTELLAQVRMTAKAAFEHQDVPFEKLVEELQLTRTLAYNPLIQVLFALQNVSAHEFEFVGLQSQPLDIPVERSLFDLELQLWETPNGLEGFFLYKTALFRAETVQRMAGNFLTLLSGIAASEREQQTYNFKTSQLLSDHEQQLLLDDWSGVQHLQSQQQAVVVDIESNVVSMFTTQAKSSPNAIAVVDADTNQQLTYYELDTHTNILANYLLTQGIGAEIPVGLCVERSIDMLIGLLAILKAGAVYLPIDPAYPIERINFILEQAQVKIVLNQQIIKEQVFKSQNRLLPNLSISASHLAYLIYTSGSTGQPKGVMVEHGALANHVRTIQQKFALEEHDRVLQFASMSFDVALEQILPALICGARVVIAQPNWSLDEFITQLQAQQITVCDLPPAYLHQVLLHWQAQEKIIHSLRLMIVGNDVLPPETVALWHEIGHGIRFINAYGPTEATITATCYEYITSSTNSTNSTNRVPIGRPLPGKTAYILDSALQLLPIGVIGELYLGGSGLARGYWQSDDLTTERFLANPFGLGRLYRTGDLARWLPDGTLEFIGRVDNQVKLRGFRIELGEIETVLSKHPAVHTAVVILREDQPGQKRLVAYWTAKQSMVASKADIMQYLQTALPTYMIPAKCVLLETMPQTANGKINRKALPIPTEENFDTQLQKEQKLHTLQPIEQQLVEIWASVLGHDRVSIFDNFFGLGGDSILSLQVVSKARQQGLQIQPKQLFQYQTIAQLATVVKPITNTATMNIQHQISGEVKLTPIQHWFFAQDFVEAQHHNLAFRAEVAVEISPEILTQAWRQVTLHHDVLRSSFVQNFGQWQQNCSATVGELKLVVILDDLENWNNECVRLQSSLNLATGELQRMALFRSHRKHASIFWCIHHLVVDGVSWRILLEDLQTACTQLLQGQAIKLPAKTTAFQTWSEWLARDAMPYVQAELAYWQEICAKQTIILEHCEPNANTETITRKLSFEDTRSLLQDAHQAYNTQINDLLLTALLQAHQQCSGQNSLRLDLEGHGRELLNTPPGMVAAPEFDLSRTVGWFTSIYPLVLTLPEKPENNNIANAIKSVKEQLRAIPNRGMGYGILHYLGKAEGLAGQAELCFNYLGQFDTNVANNTTVLRNIRLDMATQPHSPQQRRPYLVEINCLVVDRQLQVDYSYSTALHQTDAKAAFVDSFMTALQALLVHCRDPQAGGYTSSDFAQAKLKQNQLDKLLQRIQKK